MMARRILASTALITLVAGVSLAQAPPQPASLGYLTGFVGKYPPDVKLWDAAPLADRLKALLGARHATFLENVQTNGPVSAYGDVVWASGNKAHAGGTDAAIFLADTKANVIEVYLLSNASLSYFREPGANIPLQGDAKTVVANLKQSAPIKK